MGFQQTKDYLEKLESLLSFSLPMYAEEGKSSLVISVGCTGGHHRSAVIAREIAAYIRSLGYRVSEVYRDIRRGE